MRRSRRAAALAVAACALLPYAAAGTAAPSCRGAAALDPANGCGSPHRVKVTPHPDVAVLEHGPACIRTRAVQDPGASCWFPTASRGRKTTVALIGDSHAQVWRAVVDPLAASQRRRAVSLTLASCPFAHVDRINVSEERKADCYAWGDRVNAWLQRYPAVRTVYFINSSTYVFAPSGEQTGFDRGVAGYRAAFEALPPSVQHVVVIRDNPHMRYDTNACVARAISRRRRPGPACALPRDEALRPDPAAEAASQLGGRAQVVDLTRFFCDERLCYPALGGVLVYRDAQHLARDYGRSLWRYLRASLPASA
ncbi:MAG TPA: SGNH hydrolase domain-containing protein [Solirubrobacteraceae bacterium]